MQYTINCLSVAVLFWVILFDAEASHFLGGSASWKHLRSFNNTSSHEVELSFRLGWKWTYFSPRCDESAIFTQTPGQADVQWKLNPSGAQSSQYPASTETKCTTFDPIEDWSYGYNSIVANITAIGPFTISFNGGVWIGNLLFGGGSWSVALIDIDLRIRSDTGLVNNPPKTISSPIVRLQLGCAETIQINVVDEENDNISCRYAVGKIECDGICGQYQHFSLDEQSCTISYDGGGGIYLIPVALMIEDSPRQNVKVGNQIFSPSDRFSQIPLQFLVKIVGSSTACNVVPTYPSIAIPDNTTFIIPNEGIINETLYAYPSNVTLRIIRFIILGPLGVQNSDIYYLGNNIYASNIFWNPTSNQSGKHVICYYAIDESNKNGRQRCFSITVGGITNPCEIDNGGCSDVCVPTGSMRFCSCSRLCWTLAEDRKTCIPLMHVTCSGDNITVSMDACSTNKTIVAGSDVSYFSQRKCQSLLQNFRYVLSFSLFDCGLRIQSNPVEIEYVITVWTWDGEDWGSGPGQSVITRGEWQKIPVTCSLPSSRNLTGTFVPVLPLNDEFIPEVAKIEGFGTFSFFFEFYRNNDFTSSYGPRDFPLKVTVNDEIYFSLGAVGRGGLVFFTETCVALSSRTITTKTLQYTFIEKGCVIDSTTTKYNSTNIMENRFSIKAFEFGNRLLASRQNSDIFIQCEVLLCDVSANSTRCSESCVTGALRGKRYVKNLEEEQTILSRNTRDADDDDEQILAPPDYPQSSPQQISSRFILIIDPAENESNGENDTSYTNWILIGIGVILLFGLIFVAYGMLNWKREKHVSNSNETSYLNNVTI